MATNRDSKLTLQTDLLLKNSTTDKILPTNQASPQKQPDQKQPIATKTNNQLDDFPQEIIIESGKIEPDKGQSYEASEHSDIGNYSVFKFLESIKEEKDAKDFRESLLSFLEISSNPEKIKIFDPAQGIAVSMPIYEITLSGGQRITAGEIVALAGDFFAIANEPIGFAKDDKDENERKERFKKAFAELFNEKKNKEDIVKRLIGHMRKEAEAKHPHFHFNMKFIKDKLEDSTSNICYGLERAEERSLKGFWHSPYFDLGLNNFDHFGEEAKKSYLAGHKIALAKAREAGDAKDETLRKKLLKEAFLHEMFACHFLTDLFAAGHIRTPRKEILNYIVGNEPSQVPDLKTISHVDLVVAGFFAKEMHDEDGKNSVHVIVKKDTVTKAETNKSFIASGDGNFFNKKNKEYAFIVCQTVMLALKDLLLSYRNEETILDKDLSSYIPKEDKLKNIQQRKPPLFFLSDDKKKVSCRGDLINNVKEKGLIAGTYQSIPCMSTHVGMIASRFFTVTVKPAAVSAANKVVEAEKIAEKKIGELYNDLKNYKIPCVIL